jgi:hypothetical protein
MVKHPLDEIYFGVLTSDGYFEFYTERQMRKFGGRDSNKECAYHHYKAFNKLSKRRDIKSLYSDDRNIRFTRNGRWPTKKERDMFILTGNCAIDPFSRESKRMIKRLAQILVNMKGITKNTLFRLSQLRLPDEVAPYQGKTIGKIGDFL